MKYKIKSFFWILKRKVKLRTLLFLILILVVNAFAWYIYVSEVSSNITAHVRAWKIDFDNNVEQEMVFEVANIYPGMETVTKEVQVANGGEMDAVLTCSIIQMRILNDTYEADGNIITGQDLIEDAASNYPFKIKFYIDDEEISQKDMPADHTSVIKIEISWPFESGDDERDTYWGNAAYDFMQENPTEACIQIKAKLIATQQEENNE